MRELTLLAVAMMLAGTAVGAPPESVVASRTDPDRTVLAFVPQKMFREEVLEAVRRRLEYAGYRVKVAAPDTTIAVGMTRTVIRPNLTLADARPDDFAALVVIGGSGTVVYWSDTLLGDLVRAFAQSGRLVAASGVAPIVLARAGVLAGHRATVYPHRSAVGELQAAGARYVANPVVEDDNLITAADAKYAGRFSRSIIDWLKRRQ